MKNIIKSFLFIILYILISAIIVTYLQNINYLNIPYYAILILTIIPFILGIYCHFNNIQITQGKHTKISLIIFSILISCFFIYSFNIYKHNPQVPAEIEISTTHIKSEESKGYDIQLYSIKADNKIIKQEELHTKDTEYKISPDGYKYLNLISEKNNPAYVKTKTFANQIFIILNGANNSGYAQIKINDKKYLVNTFQDTLSSDEENMIYLAKPLAFQVNNNLTSKDLIHKFLYIFSYFLIFLFSVYFSGKIILNINIEIKETDKTPNIILIIMYGLPVILSGLFYLLTFYPAIMPFDCLTQWKYAHSIFYSTEHPVFHSYLIHLITRIWDSPAGVVIFQILSLGLITGYFLFKLRKYSVPSYLLYITSLLTAIIPYTGITLVTLWKDVVFSIALYALMMCSLFIIIENHKFFNSKINTAIMISSLLMVILTRYNGIYTAVLYIIILLLYCKNLKLQISKIIVITLICNLIILTILHFRIITIKQFSTDNQRFEVPFHQIQTVIKYNGKITQNNKIQLGKIVPYYIWENNYYKYVPHSFLYNTEELMEKKADAKIFLPLYLEILKSNFKIMLKDYIILNSYILKYEINPEGFNYTQQIFTSIDNKHPLTIKFKNTNSNLREKSYLPQIKSKLQKLVNTTDFYNLFCKPTPYFIIFLIFGFFFILKNGNKTIVILMPIILNLLLISVSLPEMCARYVFILFLAYPIIILLSLLKIKDTKQNGR